MIRDVQRQSGQHSLTSVIYGNILLSEVRIFAEKFSNSTLICLILFVI